MKNIKMRNRRGGAIYRSSSKDMLAEILKYCDLERFWNLSLDSTKVDVKLKEESIKCLIEILDDPEI